MDSKVQKLPPLASPSNKIIQPSAREISNLPRRSLLKGIAAATASLYVSLTLPTSRTVATPDAPAATPDAPAATPNAPAAATPDSFTYSLEAAAPVNVAGGGGNKRGVAPANIPALKGISLQSVRINPGALREVHWHNAAELNFCISGQGEFGIFIPGTTAASIFTITPGSITFVPIGASHYVRNTGSGVLHQIAGFSDESPKTFDLSNTLSLIPHDLLAQNIKLPAQSLPAFQQQPSLGMIPIEKVSLPQASAISPFTTNIHNITPKTFEGGFTVPVTSQDISALNDIGFSYLQGKPDSLREPHWHPNAAELTYIIQGSAQGGIIASDKVHQTFTVQSGDVSFVPTNWLHYLNITSSVPLIMITFFSNSSPTRIDFSQMMENFPRPLLAASLGSNLEIFQKAPQLSGDLFLISKNGSGST